MTEERGRINNPSRRSLSPIWLTVYSDLVTNLTLFFLLLYAFTRLGTDQRADVISGLSKSFTETEKVEVRAERVIKDFQDKEVELKVVQLSKEKEISDYAKVEVTEKMIKVTLKSPVLFDSASAKLKGEALNILDEITSLLKLTPGDVIVEGHTDNVPVVGGRYISNWELSSARAFSVVDYFIRAKKIEPKRFIIAGYGEFRPLVPNDMPENRALNRRIEINIIRSKIT